MTPDEILTTPLPEFDHTPELLQLPLRLSEADGCFFDARDFVSHARSFDRIDMMVFSVSGKLLLPVDRLIYNLSVAEVAILSRRPKRANTHHKIWLLYRGQRLVEAWAGSLNYVVPDITDSMFKINHKAAKRAFDHFWKHL